MVGVVFIAHPSIIFGDDINANQAGEIDDVTTTQRLIAILTSLLGRSRTIRCIHYDQSNWGPCSCPHFRKTTSLSWAQLALQQHFSLSPGIGFTMPHGIREWAFLTLLGVLGFILQFLLTAGLQLDKSSKATSMLYTQILFALTFDWAIWGVLPGHWSILGGSIITASTLWSTLQKPQTTASETVKKPGEDEESALINDRRGRDEEVADSE